MNPRSLALIFSFLLFSWLAMQAVHESGHCLTAFMTGAKLERLALHPLAISRTDVSGGACPVVVACAGPLLGVAFPLLVWLGAELLRLPLVFLFRFFAGFCLVANGVYIGAGGFLEGGASDPGALLRLGAPLWLLIIFGVACLIGGLRLWHGQAGHFGIGPSRREVGALAVAVSVLALLLTLSLEFAFGSR